MTSIATPESVLQFWFDGPALHTRPEWFKKSAAFDADIRNAFEATHAQVHAGAAEHWLTAPRSALAYVIVLDQFARNMYRDTARAFASDSRALTAARLIVSNGWDRAMHPFERQFAYLPFEHAEDRAAQTDSLRLFGELEAIPATRGLLEWAQKHAVIIERFGRYPHRNAILGRASTREELAFLQEPNSSF